MSKKNKRPKADWRLHDSPQNFTMAEKTRWQQLLDAVQGLPPSFGVVMACQFGPDPVDDVG